MFDYEEKGFCGGRTVYFWNTECKNFHHKENAEKEAKILRKKGYKNIHVYEGAAEGIEFYD